MITDFNPHISTVLNVPVEGFRVQISNRNGAGSSGKLRIGVRQGDRKCETVRATFPACKGGQEYDTENLDLFDDCRDTWFQPVLNAQALQIQVLSDSGDDNYIDEAGVKIAGKWKNFNVHQVKVNKHVAHCY